MLGRLTNFTAIDLSRQQLAAVQMSIGRKGVGVVASCVTDIPPDVDSSDEEWLGKWIGRTLAEHGCSAGPLVFVVPRQSVGLKRLVLPSIDDDELPGMVELKLSGQLPFPTDGSVIDFVVLRKHEGQSEIIAAAVRTELLDRYRDLAKAAGRRLARVALRPLATASVLAQISAEYEGTVLGIDLRHYGEVELVFTCGGILQFARGAEVISGTEQVDHQEEARRLATEAKRSWMSFRATETLPDVRHIVVIGTDGLAGDVAAEVRSALGRTAEVLVARRQVTGAVEDLGPAWPLVGVGLDYLEKRDRIDFLRPKQSPDLDARRRRTWLSGVAAVVLVGLLGWTMANRELMELERELDRLRDRSAELREPHQEYRRRLVRLEHVRRWEDHTVNWLDHLAYIWDRLPSTDRVVLSNVSGGLAEPRFRWNDRWLPVSLEARLQLSGAAVNRQIADSVREMFVTDEAYFTQTIGADSPSSDRTYVQGFTLRLTTGKPTPFPPEMAGGARRSDFDATPGGGEWTPWTFDEQFSSGGDQEENFASEAQASETNEAAPQEAPAAERESAPPRPRRRGGGS